MSTNPANPPAVCAAEAPVSPDDEGAPLPGVQAAAARADHDHDQTVPEKRQARGEGFHGPNISRDSGARAEMIRPGGEISLIRGDGREFASRQPGPHPAARGCLARPRAPEARRFEAIGPGRVVAPRVRPGAASPGPNAIARTPLPLPPPTRSPSFGRRKGPSETFAPHRPFRARETLSRRPDRRNPAPHPAGNRGPVGDHRLDAGSRRTAGWKAKSPASFSPGNPPFYPGSSGIYRDLVGTQ